MRTEKKNKKKKNDEIVNGIYMLSMVQYSNISYTLIDPLVSDNNINGAYNCFTQQSLKMPWICLLQQACDVKVCIGLIIALAVAFLIILIVILVLIYKY